MTAEEPVVVTYGRLCIGEYPIQEYIASLQRAFIERRAEFIFVDSNPHGQRFLYACVAWAMDNDIVWHDASVDDSQSISYSFRLTESGRNFLENEP